MAVTELKAEAAPPPQPSSIPSTRFPPPAPWSALGLQHVLVMYAGAVAVPLIIGRALNLAPEQVAMLISADLFACGLATLVQSFGLPGVGIRLPVMMGVTFASVAPMMAMIAAGDRRAASLRARPWADLRLGDRAGVFGLAWPRSSAGWPGCSRRW